MRQGKKKSRGKKVFQHGNYDRYYGYRCTSNESDEDHLKMWNDPRLLMIKKQYFKKKMCLDIGCNAGYLSISLAERFKPRYLLGIDLDEILIAKARKLVSYRANEKKRMELVENMGKEKEESKDDDSFGDSEEDPIPTLLSFKDYHMQQPSVFEDHPQNCALSESSIHLFPYNIFFKVEDFIHDVHYWKAYDTITCFSVTKWVHLNGGDDAILLLFCKVYALLKHYGIFILEYQPWSSYKKKKLYSPVFSKHYDEIQIKPEMFISVLQKLGFRLLSNRKPNSSEVIEKKITKGFNRNIAVLKKVGEEFAFNIRDVSIENVRQFIDVKSICEPAKE